MGFRGTEIAKLNEKTNKQTNKKYDRNLPCEKGTSLPALSLDTPCCRKTASGWLTG